MEDKIKELDTSTEVGKLKDIITILVDELERVLGEKGPVIRLLNDHGYDLCELGIICPEGAEVEADVVVDAGPDMDVLADEDAPDDWYDVTWDDVPAGDVSTVLDDEDEKIGWEIRPDKSKGIRTR